MNWYALFDYRVMLHTALTIQTGFAEVAGLKALT